MTDLEAIKRTSLGAARVRVIDRCEHQRRSLGLNYTTAPEEGRARFIPYVLHQFCQTQQLDADDPVRCDYWMDGKTDGPMSFAGETSTTYAGRTARRRPVTSTPRSCAAPAP